jgi:gluconolactonase
MKVLAHGLMFPEGPVVMPDGSIVVVELAGGQLRRIGLDGKTAILAKVQGCPNGAALGPGGKLYVCNQGDLVWQKKGNEYRAMAARAPTYDGGWIETVDPETGKVERLYDRCGEHKLRAPNDIVFDAHGGFWFTDHGKADARTVGRGGLYWAKADGSEIREAVYPLYTPNGIGLSPDGKTLYAVETQTARLWSWEITAPGQVRRLRGVTAHGGHFLAGSATYLRFDSLAVSASGKICVATLLNGGITEFWPDGSHSKHYPLPDEHVTNIAFGGPDLKTAYITMSGAGELVAIDWHEPGLKLNHQA